MARVRNTLFKLRLPLILALFFGSIGPAAFAQQPVPELDNDMVAPVTLDGKTLFRVRGVSSFPASKRAERIRQDIIDLANDRSFDVGRLAVVNEEPNRTIVMAGDQPLFSVFDEDAELERIRRELLAHVQRDTVAEAIRNYRADRSTGTLVNNTLLALGATAVFGLLFWGLSRLFRWLVEWTGRDVRRVGQNLASKTGHAFSARQFWALVASLLRLLRTLTYLVLVYFYLNAILGLYPWTRHISFTLIHLIIDPLKSLWLGFVASLPNLMFLVILWILTGYLLKFLRAIFHAIERERIRFEGFEADWAMPTYKIVRFLVIAFAVVIAYPYIPGSDSLAFKGVSVFLGVLLSLGSSSFIANLLAGLSMTYRGAFRVGDRIRIGETFGVVEEQKVMITRVRTPKNEIVVIPNSKILNEDVTNYSQLAKSEGLLLHTTVGIGYDTPWRQVEAMLIEAARRTGGVKAEPSPFVLQSALGDFAVQYQVNAYCSDVSQLQRIYSELHANVQDVFNEYGVQIMSPAYIADPEDSKVVPPEKWYPEPANKPE